jgi:hypothetical protein
LDGIPALYDKGESFDPTTRDFASIGSTRQESTFGCTQGDDIRDTIWICINIETLEPLLRQDLTVCCAAIDSLHALTECLDDGETSGAIPHRKRNVP